MPGERREHVYVFGFDQYVKIGYSRDFKKRRSALQMVLPKKLEIYLTIPGTIQDEHALHIRFKKYRLRGEWFLFTGELADWIAETAGQLSGRKINRRADKEPPYIYNEWDEAYPTPTGAEILQDG